MLPVRILKKRFHNLLRAAFLGPTLCDVEMFERIGKPLNKVWILPLKKEPLRFRLGGTWIQANAVGRVYK